MNLKPNPEAVKKLASEASMTNKLTFEFLNQKKELKEYEVEVYELQDSFFYGYDLNAQRTKQFAYDRVFNARVTGPFTPRQFTK